MGCALSKSPNSDPVNSTQKFTFSPRRLSQLQTQSPLDSGHKIAPDQQSAQLSSPPHTSGSELVLQTKKSVKPLPSPKKTDLLPTLKLPSNNPSFQDFSFKNSPEMSFDRDKERNPASIQSPCEHEHTKPDNTNPKLPKTSTPSFARNSGLRLPALNVNSALEGQSREQEVSLWSLIPPKEGPNHISPMNSAEIKEVRSEDRSSSVDRDDKDRREDLELSTGTEKRDMMPSLERQKLKEELKGRIPSVIQFKAPHRKLQHIQLSDNGDGLLESPVQSRGNTPSAGQQRLLVTSSPPKTLTMLDTPYMNDTKKSLELPDHTILSSPTNAFSIGTISNLVNLVKDVKKKDFDKKFRMNLVDLVKEKAQDEQMDSNKRAESEIQGIIGSAKSAQNGRRLSNARKFTSKILLSPKSTFSQNLINFVQKEDEVKSQATPKNKSINFNSEDMFGDLQVSSPMNKLDEKQSPGKYIMSPTQWLSGLNSPPKMNETSMLHDKTTYNIEDGMSRVDWEKYSICERVDNVEVDDHSLYQTPAEASIALENPLSSNPNLSVSVSGADISESKPNEMNLAKSKSVPYAGVSKSDGLIELAPTKSNPPIQPNKHNNAMNESVSTLQFLSPKVVSTSQISNRGRRMSKYARNDSQVIETNRVDVSVDDGGQKKINQYILIKELGRGGFGKVKLALNAETKTQHAIKIANKKKLKRKLLTRSKSAFTQLASEIAILKKLDHPNIVTLYEVMDDPNNDKLYLIMDYIKRGAVMSRNYWRQATRNKDVGDEGGDSPLVKKKMVLTEQKAKKFFRHLILGLDYLHNYAEIIHRDIKPENLLIGEDDVLRISDFGISKIMDEGDDRLENSAGTQYYQPPEVWEGKSFHGKPTDIWASGGTLFYFLVGRPPFQGLDIQKKIREEEPTFPEELNLNPKAVELIKGCLKKDPNERFTLEQIMKDPWLTDDGANPLENEEYEKPEVTEEELSKALTRVKFMAAVRVMAKLKKNLNISRANIEKRKNSVQETPENLQAAMMRTGLNLTTLGE